MPVTSWQRALLRWYERNGRAHLPWRMTRDPYRILISETMLQQTQVARVLPKYRLFLVRFPTIRTLARTSTADVLRLWRGLGYNSRAVRLKKLAVEVLARYKGKLPQDARMLRSLPGIGQYTASALRVFAFEHDELAVDTNVRRILQRLGTRQDVVPRGRAHALNSALMDLGSSICTARKPKCAICPLEKNCASAFAPIRHTRSAHAVEFKKSARYARGRIVDALRDLPAGKRIVLDRLQRCLAPVIGRTPDQIATLVDALAKDGLVDWRGGTVALKD